MKDIKKNNKDAMNSIALWSESSDSNNNPQVHLDINVWHTKKSECNYLEFGLKITDYRSLEYINIYVPYDIKKKDIEDKVEMLASNNTLTNAIFNEKLSITIGDGSFHTVEFQNNNEKFLYCEININDDIEIINDRIIKLKINSNNNINNNNEITKIYYRFRINKLDKIFTELKENYFWIDGFFRTIGFIEININSVRKLPGNIVDRLDNFKFNSLNLFIMTDNFTNFIFKSEKVHKSRILENHIWEEYLSKENSKKINKITAYHWKKDIKNTIQHFEDYNLFVKLSYISKSWLLLVLMLVFILIFGAVGGVLGNYITKKTFNNFSDINKIVVVKKGDKNATN
jgi:hypothetical protein